jgi:selenocysteine-specific elongation factor
MVAGASGIDVALLTIAADDGIMPQTREHRLILEQLGVPVGIPVLTKTDRADPEWVALLEGEISAWLASSSMAWEPIVRVSGPTGQGVEQLRVALSAVASRVAPREAADLFRLAVDRVMDIPGAGSVATGTVWSGTVRVSDRLRVLPSGATARVRSLEQFGSKVPEAGAGQRVALNLAGVERQALSRGMVLVEPEAPWVAASRVDVDLHLAADAAAPIVEQTRVRVLHGTSETFARARVIAPVNPGERGLVRLLLESPLATRGGDRVVIRSWSPVQTLGGGEVVDPDPPRGALTDEGIRAADLSLRLTALVGRRPAGVALATVATLLPVSPDAARQVVEASSGIDAIEGRLYAHAVLAAAMARGVAAVRAWHGTHPSQKGLGLEQLRQAIGLEPTVTQAMIDRLEHGRQLRIQDAVAALPGFAPTLLVDAGQVEALVRHLDTAGLAVPTLSEAGRDLGLSNVFSVARDAAGAGAIVAVDEERYTVPSTLAAFKALLNGVAASGPLTPSRVREAMGLSRKYVMPLLEWADRQRLTVRDGELRRLVVPVPCQTGSDAGYADCPEKAP